MMTPKEMFDQALKRSIGDPYDNLLSFSIETDETDERVTHLQLHADLLRDETLFSNLLTTLRAGLLTHSLHVSFQPENEDDYNVDERFARIQHLFEDLKGIQITRVPYQENGQENVQEKESSWKSYALKAGIIGVGAVAAPVIVTAGVTALGFTSAGIAAGSTAAGIMSSYGGSVAAGSFCAVMQSIGAAGLGATGTAVASTVGGAVVGASAKVFSYFRGRKNDDDKGEKTQSNSDNDPANDEEEKCQFNDDNSKNNDEEEHKPPSQSDNDKTNDDKEDKIHMNSNNSKSHDNEEEKTSESQPS